MGERDPVDIPITPAGQRRTAAMNALEARFDADAHAAGERVRGSIAVPAALECSSVSFSLRYGEESHDGYTAGTAKDGPVRIHEGPLRGGEKLDFDLQLPERLLPGISIEGGRTFWAVCAEVEIDGRPKVRQFEIPVRPDPSWEGFAAGDPPEAWSPEGEGSDWDLRVARISPWSLRAGEELGVDVELGKPEAGRQLTLAVQCHAGQTATVAGEGQSRAAGITEVVWERTEPLDPTAPLQTLRFRIPDDALFAYDGTVVWVQWWVVATEPRRMRKDLKRMTSLQVRP